MKEYKEVIYEKGYVVEITSFENDGDYYATNEFQVKDKESAIEILKFCSTVFESHTNNGKGIGNSGYDDYEKDFMVNYAKNNLDFWLKFYNTFYEETKNELTDIEILDMLHEIYRELFGHSEYYYRVYEHGVIYYYKEDVEVTVYEL